MRRNARVKQRVTLDDLNILSEVGGKVITTREQGGSEGLSGVGR